MTQASPLPMLWGEPRLYSGAGDSYMDFQLSVEQVSGKSWKVKVKVE